VEYLDAVYQRQRLKDDVDELNKLYVALTRAKEEMYVVGVFEEERKEPTRFLPDEGYEPGVRPSVPSRQSNIRRTLPVFHHNTRRPYTGVVPGRIGLLETKRGEAIHSVLSHIEYVEDDLDAQIDTVLRKLGDTIDRHFTPYEIQQVVKSFLDNDEVKKLFVAREGRRTFREKDFANAAGLLYRMDRVIVDSGEVTVVDFKTGGDELEEEYRKQVQNYMALLRDVYPSAGIHGVIAYVDKKVLRQAT
jgi:ATP-dependent exoDNAse (exonuclease V) beta subunit